MDEYWESLPLLVKILLYLLPLICSIDCIY